MLIPDTILQGRYRIVRQLGQGGMGTVFEAVDQRLDTTVALKQTLFTDERLSKQFEREARLLARLHHPALPRVSDHFSESDGQFLVMQYIAGEDLAEMIVKRQGPFPSDQVMTWADQLLDALDYLHTQDPQIIHRDIKPQNLKLTSRGQIILLDFGLAKGQASEISRITTSASIFGYTPNYAPLEQVQGLGTDPRSDIYSLSATLYHLLTGEKPPDALTRAAAIVNGQPDPLKPANEVNPGVSSQTAAVLAKAMSQNREQRYESAAAMRKAFQGSDAASTLVNRTEANTVLFPSSAATLASSTQLNPNQPTAGVMGKPETALPGETTIVRKPEIARRSAKSQWGLAFAAIAVLAVGGFGFYAYRQAQNSAVAPATQSSAADASNGTSEAPVTQAPAATPEAAPASPAPETKDETAAVKKESAAAEKTATARETKKTPKAQVEQNSAEDVVGSPEIPEVDVPNPPNQPSTIRAGRVTIRTFPDGTQVITQPDGRRILVRPDGTRQIINPVPRPRRRPRLRP